MIQSRTTAARRSSTPKLRTAKRATPPAGLPAQVAKLRAELVAAGGRTAEVELELATLRAARRTDAARVEPLLAVNAGGASLAYVGCRHDDDGMRAAATADLLASTSLAVSDGDDPTAGLLEVLADDLTVLEHAITDKASQDFELTRQLVSRVLARTTSRMHAALELHRRQIDAFRDALAEVVGAGPAAEQKASA